MSITANETDLYYSRLPWADSQAALLTDAAPIPPTRVGVAGWHGTSIDPERGANVVLPSDGLLSDLLGERLRISAGTRSIVVYAHAYAEILEDLSLTRPAFVRLALLARTELPVRVEVLA